MGLYVPHPSSLLPRSKPHPTTVTIVVIVIAIIGVISEQVLAQLDEIASCMAIVSKKPNMWF
jgi:hypothetical protein